MTDQLPIVVGVDGSPGCAAAVRYGASRALKLDRPLRLVHVRPSYVPPSGLGAPGMAFMPLELEDVARQILSDAEEVARETLRVDQITTQCLDGNPAAGLDSAAMHGHELVLGTDHSTLLERYYFGSVVGAVAGEAAVPLTVVPDSWTSTPSADARIVVGIKDYERIPQGLLGAAFEAAHAEHMGLEFVHVWNVPRKYGEAIGTLLELPAWQWNVEQEVKKAIGDLADEFADVSFRMTTTYGNPAKILRDHSSGAALMLIARPPHWVRHFGHTTHSLVRDTGCPIRIVPVPHDTSDGSGIERSEPAQWLTAQF